MATSPWTRRGDAALGCGLDSEQLELVYSRRDISADFERFNRENPHIYRRLVNLCREVRGAGHEQYSMKALFERLRWWYHIELKSKEPFLLNNNFTSHYARLIMRTEPDLYDFFEVRKLRSKQ